MVRTTNPGHRQRLREALAGDRGAATLQNTIIAPVLLLVLAVFLHLGIILHANTLAHAAATRAYTAARAYNPHVNPHVDLVRHAYVDDSNVAGIVLKV